MNTFTEHIGVDYDGGAVQGGLYELHSAMVSMPT